MALSIDGFGYELFPAKKSPLDRKREMFNRRARHPLGFNFSLLGPVGLMGFSVDYFIVPKIDIEVGAGLDYTAQKPGYFVGGKYHFFGNTLTNLTPYLGVYSAFHVDEDHIQSYNFYVPFGFHRIKRKQLCWSIEIAYQVHADPTQTQFYGAGKVGWRF